MAMVGYLASKPPKQLPAINENPWADLILVSALTVYGCDISKQNDNKSRLSTHEGTIVDD